MLRTILILLFLVFRMSFFAQCPITVDAGPDGFVCGAGQQVTLNGSVTGNYLGFNWSPPAGLDDPQSLTPVATVTGAMTYTLTAFAEDPSAPNLVTNPAFENGNTGFSSNFAFTSSPLSPGTYYITTSPSVVISTFPPCDDHTFGNGTGNMMLVNGTGSPADVWCQSIAVNPNTYYVMNAWAMASPISPPSLQFSINGTLVGNPYNVSGGCNWQQFAASWFSGPATTALFCITDQSGSGNGMFGDDFALDDVYFGEACSVSDDVMVDVVDVQAVTPLLTILECNALPAGIQLDGTGSSAGPFITYEWTTGNGHIISGANTLTPVVDEEGIYTLTVTFDNGSVVCTDVASTEVLPDPDFVLAIAFAPQGIDCTNPTTTIDGGGSSGGAFITYEWTPPAGIVSGGNTPYPIVDMGGTYTLLVTNTESGCTATTQVEVEEDTTQPTAVAGVPGNINCTQPEQTLSGAGSSTGPEFSYLWTAGSGGHIVSGETTLNNCVVDSAGIYQLTVTNDQNGCSAFATLVVEGDLQPPIAIAQANENIDCVNPTVQVSGNGSTTGMGITYEWTTNNGHIVSGEMSLTATVDSGGVYVLTVADAANGCTASDTVVVLENTTLPVAVAAAPAPITCLNDQVSLDGSSSSAGVPYVPVWTTTNGHILSGDSTLSPVVDMAATYLLTVTDTVNGCTATATATVTADIQPPVSEAGQPLTIGCNAAPVSLNGTGSSAGTYLWTTLGGHILSGQSTLMPQVDAAGWYYLTTTNPANGCSATDSVQVTPNGNAPTAMATINGQLDCNTTQLTIDGSGSAAGPDITISWQTSDGHFLSGQSTLQPVVNEGGTYTLTLTDQNSGCTATTSVIVEQDTLLPTIVIAPPPMLNCYYPMDTLDASASSQGAAFTLNWQTPNGHFVFGEMTPAPVIDSPGVYILTIINSVNGCQS
ncbi:MAG TPA: hypothetical protein ENJ20_00355, partial [Bacteroidetes bacterium]|nr:hypothetical protein [Bacteroidota bacterium]